MAKVHISKLDAAVRQLREAINMFFRNGDAVAIHSLASASQEVLESLGLAKGIKSVRRLMMEMIHPERQKEVADKMAEAKNFFKHAGKDSSRILEFNTDTTEFVLMDAVLQHHYLTGEKVPLFVAYNLWMYAKHPDIVVLSPEQKAIYDALTNGFDPRNRDLFLQMVPVFEQTAQNRSGK